MRGAHADHVVLVCVDALRSEFFLDAGWPAPGLQARVAEGAHAVRLRTVAPSLTYPAHATLVTGALPARHGIVYNRPFDPAGPTERWYWEASHLRARTLWAMAREAGGRVMSLGWPVSVGAPADWNLPEVWDPAGERPQLDLLREHCAPSGLWDELEPVVRAALREGGGARPEGGPGASAAGGPGRLAPGGSSDRAAAGDENALPADLLRGYDLRRAEAVGRVAAHLIERHRPQLSTIHLIVTDTWQHEEGRDGPRVRAALAAADRAVQRIVAGARRAGIQERTAFVVAGDHGFVDVHTELEPNIWLAEAGLRGAPPDRGDWRITFHVEDGAAFAHLRDPGDGAAAGEALRLVRGLPPPARDHFRVVERAELDRLGAAPEAAFALSATAGAAFTDDAGEGAGEDGRRDDHGVAGAAASAVRKGSGGAHGHFPGVPGIDGGLLAWGAGVRRGVGAREMRLVDVAPLAAALLGLEFEAPDGHAPLAFLEGGQ